MEIHHIGSTSVPGLSAKPILDILPVVKNIVEVDKATDAMILLGYDAQGESGMAFRRFFQKGAPNRTHNVHVYEVGDPEIDRYLRFRDWMRSHDDDAAAYAKIKISLAEEYPEDILQYCQGKDAFVASIDKKNGFQGWRMVQALTEREWKAVHALRNEDSFPEALKQKNHIHFVFYKNADIIGYAHLELCQEAIATIHRIVIDENFRNRGYETQFRALCERWLTHQI